ncbi:alpha-E domain-containing protein [Actinospica sp. MGRD01-02]|uniref:Alpha-E domain-containing protein n=1 Tax=Actinospica acidithermotolerans TaxID=2828514 RepID=A0A941IH87_9ACTN|nr:alpha-E domain-containing protein [Actinospica acidithermotolerans]MBR7828270.1 alpha-E domain-containing protein [Actinospica acidithermotolerans]
MLSRIAESLFWLGRYVERADDTARILDAFMHRLLDDPATDEHAACRTLYAILGVEPAAAQGARYDAVGVMDLLGFDTANPSAVAGAWCAARDNARGVSEVISTEAWECLNATWHALPGQRKAAGRIGPYAYLRFVRERAALFCGLADSTMSRDDGWLFLTIGRSLERVDMTARLLSAKVVASRNAPDWSTLLRAAGADEPHRRTLGWGRDPQSAARFLLLDQTFPRSVIHALSVAEQCLATLAGGPHSARRDVGRMRTMLEYAEERTFGTQLTTYLKELQEGCVTATRHIADEYFQYSAPLAWQHRED